MGFFNRKGPVGPDGVLDLSAVDSRRAALAAVRAGRLQPLLLLPAEFGGSDVPENVVYVPVETAEAKRDLELGTIRPLIEDGKVERYSVVPRYAGASFVPVALDITASGVESYSTTLVVWGDPEDGS